MEKTANIFAKELLNSAGIQINGNRSWDIQIHNENFYGRVLRDGALGLGESYMDGWWDCERLDQFFDRIVRAELENKIKKNKRILFRMALQKFFNLQTKNVPSLLGKNITISATNFFTTC